MAAAVHEPLRSRLWAKLLAIAGLVLFALVLLVAFFPWDSLRGPIGRYVSDKTGRHFEITRHLDVKVGRTTRVLMDGVVFGNPDWAQDRNLVKADAAEVDIRLLPLLFHRRIELPLVRLTRPELGLQMEADGRKTWALGQDTKDDRNVPLIGAVIVDQGTAHYLAKHQGADVRAEFAMDRKAPGQGNADALPLGFKAKGRWADQPFTAEGRTGDVLSLNAPQQQPFPAQVVAKAGATSLEANGTIASLAALDGLNVDFRMQGNNLADLYQLLGVVLPDSPRYTIAGHLARSGERWQLQKLEGKLGRTDIAGDLAFEKGAARPMLTGNLKSNTLDFEDLAPLIGMKDKPAPAAATRTAVAAADAAPAKDKDKDKDKDKGKKPPRDPNRKVLPNAPLDVSRLKTMNADVRVDAARVVNAKGLPLDRVGTHVVLKDGLLVLDPLDLGLAGGRLAGHVRLDANKGPVAAQAAFDARGLDLSRLLPKVESMRNSFGKLQAQVDLSARGNSVAQMLASANGNVALLMGRGQISNIALEFAGLDGGEIIKFFLEGDQQVEVRCAAVAFGVERGVMQSRALLLDTDDTVFHGDARIDLAREEMNVYVKPQPKDQSILSLRSPLHMTGTFGAPQIGIDKGPLAGRAVAALALGALNPLLALAATVETGPGHDADCVGTLRNVSAPRAEARVQQTAPPVAGSGGKTVDDPARRMGAASSKDKSGAKPADAAQPAARPTMPAGGTPGQPVAP